VTTPPAQRLDDRTPGITGFREVPGEPELVAAQRAPRVATFAGHELDHLVEKEERVAMGMIA
jgi:hypothetical protein